MDGLSFNVLTGEVLGFLGPNGAGKTTTIRMCLHLIRPTSGRVRVFGDDVWAGGARSLNRVGCLIESPAVLPFMSGRPLGATAGNPVGPVGAQQCLTVIVAWVVVLLAASFVSVIFRVDVRE